MPESIIGYKVAKTCDEDEEKRVIITLEIPDNAIINIGRNSVLRKMDASYRTNLAKVVSIEGEDDSKYDTAVSAYAEEPVTYKVDEIIEIKDFDTNLEQVYASGIHFFLNKYIAQKYRLKRIPDCIVETWYENGVKRSFETYKDGKFNGEVIEWYENGQMKSKCEYVNDYVLVGKRWFPNDILMFEYTKIDDTKFLVKGWHSNGVKSTEIEKNKENQYHGYCKEWDDMGILRITTTYINNNKNGITTYYYKNGQKRAEQVWDKGNLLSYKEWNEDGKITKTWNNFCVIM